MASSDSLASLNVELFNLYPFFFTPATLCVAQAEKPNDFRLFLSDVGLISPTYALPEKPATDFI
jgi:hypothetical protein